MDAPWLRIVGDVHGMVRSYVEMIEDCNAKYSLQIGDLGFGYMPLRSLPWKNHKFIGGNHDNYDYYYDVPHALGDYGRETLGGLPFYYIRGAFSIDVKPRQKAELRGHPKSWWKEEVLPKSKLTEARQDYLSRRPRTMITHTCPTELARQIGKPEALVMFGFNPLTFTEPTQDCLQDCFDGHKPDVWIFGHFHKTIAIELKGTLFICLNEFEHLDVDKKGNFRHLGHSGRIQ